MAPAASAADIEQLAAYFEQCGLAPTAANETARGKQANSAKALFSANKLETKQVSTKQGLLALQIAKDGQKLTDESKTYVLDAVLDNRLKAPDQVTAAIKYLLAKPAPVDSAAFDKACGVGFSATPEQVEQHVRAFVGANKADVSKLGWNGSGKMTGQMKATEQLRWVNALDLKSAVEKVYEEMFGNREQAKAAAAASAKTKKEAPKTKAAEAAAVAESPDDMFATGWLSRLHKPGGNEQVYPERMQEHLEATGGKVFTRFPPEPNGFLHIGHSKAIAVNFGYAKYHKGHCYLRYDDTNPEAEEQIYFDKILEAVRWLGYEPYKITHSSDNFGKLYDLACELIKAGLAYTSNDTAEEINAQRGGKDHGPRHDSKDRNKPVEQSLKEFADMRAGRYKPGEMILRMKQDMESSNPTMWDIIAYRVLSKPHHRTGTEWCIYPTYDFTHCLCDSFENISHSLCTTEFIGARTAYEWLCDALKVYKPRQSEYGRLSLEGAITSKRKLLRLVKEGHVSGWDDSRLHTLIALKRRGVPPAAIISFVSNLGVSTSSSLVQLSRFEQTVRQHLEMTTPRLMLIVNPVKVTIENLPKDYYLAIEKPLHTKNPALGSNTVPFTPTVYIDADDFRGVADKDFFRLCPGATVGLLNVPRPITYVSHEEDSTGKVTSIVCRYEDGDSAPKPKAWIQWVAEHAPSRSPVHVKETRLFSRLFKSDDPASLGDDYIKDIDPDSKRVVKGALLETGIWKVIDESMERVKKAVEERLAEAKKEGTEAPPMVEGVEAIRFQGVRVAYFCLDQDSVLADKQGDAKERGEGDEIILNLIAPLKQDAGAGKKV